MKSFLSNNWYKLMVASSLFIFSVGFFIYAVSPAYANTEKTKVVNFDNHFLIDSQNRVWVHNDGYNSDNWHHIKTLK